MILLLFSIFSQMLDSLNIRSLGKWPYGPARSINLINDTIAYVKSGCGVYVFNIRNPAQPLKISEFPFAIGNGEKEGNFFLSAEENQGLGFYDISDPTTPILISRYITPDLACKAYLKDRIGYVACAFAGLRIIDYSDPTNPVEIGYYDTPGSAVGIFISQGYAYVADGSGGLRIINIEDPRNPFEVGYYQVPRKYASYVYVSFPIAYVAFNDAFRILDISTPSQPRLLSTVSATRYISYVLVEDSIAYLADMPVKILNVKNPYQPLILSSINVYGGEIKKMGNLIYIIKKDTSSASTGERGFLVVDVENLRNPLILSTYTNFPSINDGIFVKNNHAYLATRNNGMMIFDVSNPFLISYISEIDTIWVSSIIVSSNLAYLGIRERNQPMVKIVDISSPQNPQFIGAFETLGRVYYGMALKDTLLFVPSFSSQGVGIIILNVQEPRNPYQISFIPCEGTPPWSCAVWSNFLFVADGLAGIKIFDITDVYNPLLIGRYDTEGSVTDIKINFPYAYISDGGRGFRVINISDPKNPYEIAQRNTRKNQAWSLDYENNIVYIADGFGGIIAFDVSDPFNPLVAGFYQTPVYACQVQVKNNKIYVADSEGFIILQYYGSDIKEKTIKEKKRNKTRGEIYDISGKLIKDKKLKKGIYFQRTKKGIKKIIIF